jgi:hypothetical protein
MNDRFDYQTEQLSKARRMLMAPLPAGEPQGFASAFHELSLAFDHFDIDQVKNDDARGWIRTILHLLGTSDAGSFQARAEQMSIDEKLRFSQAVDDLANWFDRNFWQK